MSSIREAAAAVHEKASQAMPSCGLPLPEFLTFLESAEVSAETLGEYGEELFLACACGAGDEPAIAVLERDYFCRVVEFVGRFRLSDEELGELGQTLRIRLLVGPRPGILNYRGAGPLGAWLRITAIRLAVNQVEARPGARDRRADSGIWERLASDCTGPELRAAQTQHQEVFAAALEASLLALDPRERTLLRMHLVDGLNIDAISTIYRVHRSTAARWLIAIRDKVFSRLRRTLSLELRTTSGELRSLVRVLRADIQVSLERILESVSSQAGLPVPRG